MHILTAAKPALQFTLSGADGGYRDSGGGCSYDEELEGIDISVDTYLTSDIG